MLERIKPPLPSQSRNLARALRRNQTEAELRLWQCLRPSRLGRHKFRRQHPAPPYVLDSYCETARVAVELDGSQHSAEADAQRTTFLNAAGIEVLRFWDNDVIGNTALVPESILSSIQSRTLTPSLSPGGRGEQSEHSIP